MTAPIAFFVFNRPEHTRRVLESLRDNERASESVLHIFADGPRKNETEEGLKRIAEVRQIIGKADGFREVKLHLLDENKGCARSVREGITEIVEQAGRIIVVEDDVVCCPSFLGFINDALDFYYDDKRIWTIGGMNIDIQIPETYVKKHDLFLVHRTCSWGWGTWSDRWRNIDWEVSDADRFFANPKAMRRFDRGGEGMTQLLRDQLEGRIDAWDIVWDYHIFKHNGFCIRPIKSLTYNIGMDGSGTHYNDVAATVDPQAPLFNPDTDTLRLERHLRPSSEVQRIFYNYWSSHQKVSPSKFVKRKLKRVLRAIGLIE